MKVSTLLFIFFALGLAGCKKDIQEKSPNVEIKAELKDTVRQIATIDEAERPKEKITVLIVPISNGYGYPDFNPVLKAGLQKNTDFEVLDFPLKKFNGSGFQGVNDKRYAKKILEKVEADVYIMSWFATDAHEIPKNGSANWGYTIKLLNGKTMEQKNSVSAQHLKNYEAIEEHIADNINRISQDIKKLL